MENKLHYEKGNWFGKPINVANNVKEAIGIFVLFAIIIGVIYFEYYAQDMIPMSGDTVQWISDMTLYKNILKNGELPIWNKYLEAGIPLECFTAPSVMMIFSFIPIKELIYMMYIGFVALGGSFMYLYLLELGCTKRASFTISLCYILSIHLGGNRKSHIFLIITTTLLPAIIYFIERYVKTVEKRYLIYASVVMSIQFSVGFMQQVVYTDIVMGLYLIIKCMQRNICFNTILKHSFLWVTGYIGLIAWKIIPVLLLLRFNKHWGAVGTEQGMFESYSIHPIKLLEMIYPRIFDGEVYQAFGSYMSSELDIEIFLGSMITLLIMVGFINIRKNKNIKLSLGFCIGTFCYAALRHIPFLSDMIFKIPVLNGFRVPSRTLFIFIFFSFVTAAVVLSEIEEGNISWNEFFKNILFSFGTIVGMTIIGIVAASFSEEQIKEYINIDNLWVYIKTCLAEEIVVMIIIILFVVMIRKRDGTRQHVKIKLLYTLLISTTIMQTYQYTSVTQPMKVADVYINSNKDVMISENIGNYKIWDALKEFYVNETPVYSNLATSKEISSLGAYIAFNNPRIYRYLNNSNSAPLNGSEALIWSPLADQNLKYQNDFLSMLGVKYIFDSSRILENDNGIIEYKKLNHIYNGKMLYSEGENHLIYQAKIDLEKNNMYNVTINYEANRSGMMNVDFFSEGGYDGAEQEITVDVKKGINKYSGYIFSGEFDDSIDDIYIRVIVPKNTVEIDITEITVTPIEAEVSDEYKLWEEYNFENEDNIFINENARDILYVPNYVKSENNVDLFAAGKELELDDISYVEGGTSYICDRENTTIDSINFEYTKIRAKIKSEKNTFVNFSQSYYPGWNGYVDDVKKEVKIVNGVIMGMEVDSGEHIIEFKYEPYFQIPGIFITILTALILWNIGRRR